MAECKELLEMESQSLVEVAPAEEGVLVKKVEEMILTSVQSVGPSLIPGNPNPTQIVMGKNNTTLSGCNFNITNIYGGDNGTSLQKSEVTEVDSPCLLPPRNEDGSHQAREGMSSSPSPMGTKSNERILRVVPLATEMEDCDDDLILVVWFCWDDDQTFQKILKSEHDNGNVTLDSYDTIVIKRPDSRRCTIPVQLKTNEDYSWEPRETSKSIPSSRVWNADRAKCAFRIQKNHEHPESELMYLTLVIKGSDDPAGTQFIVKKKVLDIKMPREDKRRLFNHLDANTSVRSQVKLNFAQSQDDGCGFQRGSLGDRSLTCWAIPYIDRLFSTEDDVVVTLWLCWYDKKGKLLEGLKGEQKLYGREALDTENSLILENSEEKIEVILKHNGYHSQRNNKKAIDAHRIVQGARAKFQFISKRIEDDYDYAARILATSGKGDPAAIEKELLSERSRDNQLMPKLKPNRLDVEIAAWQGDQVPTEFTKVTEVTQFVCGVENMTSRSGIFSRLKSHIRSGCHKYKTMWAGYGAADSWKDKTMWAGYGAADSWKDKTMWARYAAADSWKDKTMWARYAAADSWKDKTMWVRSGAAGHWRVGTTVPDLQKMVLRLYIFVSQDTTGNVLNIHLVLVTMDSLKSLQNVLAHGEWAAVDSYDTFLLTSQVCGHDVPPVEVTYKAHRTSSWQPESERMSVEVNEILKDGMWKCSCKFYKKADSQNKDLFFSTVRISQRGNWVKQEANIYVKKKVKDIETLIKGASSSALEHTSPALCWPNDAGPAVMLDDHETCLAVAFVEPVQSKADDIVLTVWICSIRQSQDDFYILCEEQEKFMKKQLDTENSFVLFDMTSPVKVILRTDGLCSIENPSQQPSHFQRRCAYLPFDECNQPQSIHPQRIREGGRVKCQFIVKPRTYNNFSKLLVEVTICQNDWNAVQFMTRKKVDFFWQDDLRTEIQDVGTESSMQTVAGLS